MLSLLILRRRAALLLLIRRLLRVLYRTGCGRRFDQALRCRSWPSRYGLGALLPCDWWCVEHPPLRTVLVCSFESRRAAVKSGRDTFETAFHLHVILRPEKAVCPPGQHGRLSWSVA